jgi:ketosteroid isomerase-like protein
VTSDNDAARACDRLIADFAFHVDRRNAEEVAALFTPDGLFDRRGQKLEGRAMILAAQLSRSPEFVTRHACVNVRIDVVDATHARGTCTFTLYRMPVGTSGEATLPYTIGDYEDAFERTAEGWRIARRVAHIVYQSPG